MKRTNLKSTTFTLLAAVAAVIFTAHESRVQAQTNEKAQICRTTYEQMRRYAESRSDIAAAFGKVFLGQGCGQVFPTVVEPVKNYIAAVEQQQANLPAANRPANTPTEKPTPTTGGTPRSLPGTAWKIDFGKGVTGAIFLFCKSGRWEIVPAYRTIGAIGRSYSVSGSTLTTVNADDGRVEKWKMTWKGDVLELFDGKVTLGLHYNGETQCK
jgi:hypothetical protein